MPDDHTTAGGLPRRLCVYTGGFLRDARIRRILTLAGYRMAVGWPGSEDGVAVWGRSHRAWRGERVAARAGVPLVRIEDAFLRSVHPGRAGAPTLGLMLDGQGVYFDAERPSRLETLLQTANLSESRLQARAEAAVARLQALHLSKYNIHDPALPVPEPGYVLLVDQTRGDAAITHGGADGGTFAKMLAHVRATAPRARIVIKSHPETSLGLRPGHFSPEPGVELITAPVSPWRLLAGAAEVHVVTSHLGWEAVLAGHRPVVWGSPWYAGWGLTDDRQPVSRRTRQLTAAQVFAAAMILAPVWYDPCRDRLCEIEDVIDQLEAEVKAFREDRHGHVATAMRLWKRGRLQAIFGREKPVVFIDDPQKAAAQVGDRGLLVWAGKEPPGLSAPRILRVEDGFLRSRGLGAELVPPLSLVTDDRGIYYDPGRESRLEVLVATPLPPGGRARALRFLAALRATGVTKYNLGGGLPDLPVGHRILIPGQVEDDASILTGAGDIRTNAALIRAVRAANPHSVLVYKPHPDIEAGLRSGAVEPATLALADVTASRADPVALIDACDEVWTMTSTLGWEALLRGKPVTTLGAPFYAGWGLTTDLGPTPARRTVRPDLPTLAHAVLIAYPRYFDPVSSRPCPPEVALERLANGTIPHSGPANRALAKLQGAFAGYARLWR